MKGYIFFSMLFFFSLKVSAQLVIGSEETNEPQKEKKTTPQTKDTTGQKTIDGNTTLYFVSNWSRTNRDLEPNGNLYGEPLGKRSEETYLDTWSFGLGMRNKLNTFLYWDGGISYVRNGESYMYKEVDTSFSYQTTYSYIGMPLRVNYFMGQDFQWFIGGGVMPQMFLGYKQESQWTTSTNSSGDATFKTNSGYNSFVISALLNAGIVMNFSNHWGVLVSTEARWQLNSTYIAIDGLKHKASAYGITFGLIRNL